MKKFLFLSIVVFAMTVVGCTSQPRDINKPNKVMMDKLPCDRVYEFKYKGHDYLSIFRTVLVILAQMDMFILRIVPMRTVLK